MKNVEMSVEGNTLTIKDQSNATIGVPHAATAPVSEDGMVWTYTVPAADLLGKLPQTFHFSVNMAGVVETESTYGILYGIGGLGEVVHVFGPKLGFFDPKVLSGVGGFVIEED
ncbi:MAG: hypothetical protein ABSE73_23215, partial [Planctomycetota bacterium]